MSGDSATAEELKQAPAPEVKTDVPAAAKDNKSFASIGEELEEETPSTEVKQEVKAPEVKLDVAPPPPLPKPEGWDQVDFTKIQDPELRAQFEARFNRLYGQVKSGERQWQEVRQYQQRLESQIAQLQQATAVSLNNDEESQINTLKTKFQEAYDKGDTENVIKILGELNQKDVEKKMREQMAAQYQQSQQQTEQQSANQPQVPEAAKTAIQNWAKDKPYAQRGHALFDHTLHAMNHFLNEGAKAGKDLPWLIKTTEDYMNGQLAAQAAGQPAAKPAETGAPKIVSQVLPQQQGVRTNATQKGPNLSEEQKIVARKLFNRMKPAEAYAKYAQGLK